MDRIDPHRPKPTPRTYPTAPLPPAAVSALARLELRLAYPTGLYRALTRPETQA